MKNSSSEIIKIEYHYSSPTLPEPENYTLVIKDHEVFFADKNTGIDSKLIMTLSQEEYSELVELCKHLGFECFNGKDYYNDGDCDGGYYIDLRFVTNKKPIIISVKSCAEFKWEKEFWQIVDIIESYK